MDHQKSGNKPQVHSPWQPRFGTRGLLLLMLVVSVMGAGGYYLIQALQGGRSFQLVFIVFTLASPLLIMVLASLVCAILGWKPRDKH